MIGRFRHRGLRELYEQGRSARVTQSHVAKLLRILAALDRSSSFEDMDVSGFRLHPLRGRLKDFHSVTVSANWRVISRYEDGLAVDVDYLDYH